MSIVRMTDLDLSGKRVLIREDLNVLVKDGVVKSDARILTDQYSPSNLLNSRGR